MERRSPDKISGMFLYHGTSARFLDTALIDGIRPRGEGASNWENAPSHSDRVYLSNGYPFYYSVIGTDDPKVIVFEIDSELIDERRLYPDEDYFWGIADRTGEREHLTPPQVAEHLEALQDQWPKSLHMLGNVAHRGMIPAAFITRYCIYEAKARPSRTFAMADYSINVLNYLYERHTFYHLVAWMFVDKDLLPWVQDEDEERRDFWLKESEDRMGIEVVIPGR